MFRFLVFVPLLAFEAWAVSVGGTNSTSDINKIHIVIELRKSPTNASAPEEVLVYQEIEESPEMPTTAAVPSTSSSTKPPRSTSAPFTPTSLPVDSSEEVVRRHFATYVPRYRPTIAPVAGAATANAKGPQVLLMGNRPTVDFLKRHFPQAQVVAPPSNSNMVRNARRTLVAAKPMDPAAHAESPGFEVVGMYKERSHRVQ